MHPTLNKLKKCRCPICRDRGKGDRVNALRDHFYNRSIHNAWTIINQSHSWPRSRKALSRLVANGGLGSRWKAR